MRVNNRTEYLMHVHEAAALQIACMGSVQTTQGTFTKDVRTLNIVNPHHEA